MRYRHQFQRVRLPHRRKEDADTGSRIWDHGRSFIIAAITTMGFTAFLALPVHAAEVWASAVQQEIRPLRSMEISFFMDTRGREINAVEGTAVIPSPFEIQEVRDGNSDVTFWVERPAHSREGNVHFAGVIPGGRTDEALYLFSAIVRGGEPGSGQLGMTDLRVLLNDGEGTAAPSAFRGFAFSVRDDAPEPPPLPPKAKDLEPPESFEPLIVQDPAIADGKKVVVFMTQDKGSGVAHYEVFETRRELTYEEDVRWIKAESPYVLKDQELKSYVYVKATDREGNERIRRLEPLRERSIYENNMNWIILLVAFCAGFIVFIVRKRYGGVHYFKRNGAEKKRR